MSRACFSQVFITIAGKGLHGEVCIELLMGSVFGIAALASRLTSDFRTFEPRPISFLSTLNPKRVCTCRRG